MENAEITFLIIACAKAHRSALSDKLRALGLFLGQDILLARVAEVGPASQKTLATSLHLEEATISESIKKLARAGLVERLPHASDRRAYQVVATEKGAKVADKVRKLWAEYEAKAVASLSEEQIDTLKISLTNVLAQIT